MKSGRALFVLVALAAAAQFAGCARPSANIVPVSGKVTLDGQPLVGANITFQPITDKAATANSASGSFAKTDAEGKFTLELITPEQPGALVGKHRVTIATAVFAEAADDDLKLAEPEKVPARYTDGSYELEVPAGGTDQANIEIVTK